MIQNHKQNQFSLNTVFYVKTTQNGPPFIACIEMKPYINILSDKSQFVQTIAPYSKNHIGIPNLNIPPNIFTVNQLNNSHNQQENTSQPNHKDIEINKSSEDFNFISDILILLTLGFSVTTLIFYSFAFSIFINLQYNDDISGLFISLISCYSIVIILRFIFHLRTCFKQSMSFGQRVSFAASLFCPLLKYHMIKRKSNEFRFSLKITLISDGASTLLIFVAGIFSLIIYIRPYTCYECQKYLYTGIFLLIEMFFQILGYLLYRNFIKENFNSQKDLKYHSLHRKPDIENTNNGKLDSQLLRQLYPQNRGLLTDKVNETSQETSRHQYS